jgi:hypothetical protein
MSSSFEIVKAGLAGLHTGRSEYLDPIDRVPCPEFFSGHGTPMLSDQALKQGRLEDALACTGDEGRSKLR